MLEKCTPGNWDYVGDHVVGVVGDCNCQVKPPEVAEGEMVAYPDRAHEAHDVVPPVIEDDLPEGMQGGGCQCLKWDFTNGMEWPPGFSSRSCCCAASGIAGGIQGDEAMATRWRVLNRRRRRKAQQTEYIRAHYCQHRWLETYYGTECRKCDTFYAFDCAPWDDYESDAYYDDYDGDCDSDCGFCGGDGWVDGYEEDAIFYAPDELIRCASCGGSGNAKDMTIW